MPLPKPKKITKSQKEFIQRCMADPYVQKEGKDNKQKLAICYAQWQKY